MSLPEREVVRVRELATELSDRLGISQNAAQCRIYRAVEAVPQRLPAQRVGGSICIERAVAARFLKGERR